MRWGEGVRCCYIHHVNPDECHQVYGDAQRLAAVCVCVCVWQASENERNARLRPNVKNKYNLCVYYFLLSSLIFDLRLLLFT